MNAYFVLIILTSQSFNFIASFIHSSAIYLVLDKGFLGVDVGFSLVCIHKTNAVALTQV